MFIAFAIKQSASSVGATCAGNQADMPLLRSFGRLADGFYKHVAPTALRLGSHTRQVFRLAVSSLLKYPFQRRRRDMSIDSPIKKSASSVGATCAGTKRTCRSYGALAVWPVDSINMSRLRR